MSSKNRQLALPVLPPDLARSVQSANRYGMTSPYVISRNGPRPPSRQLRPRLPVPTLVHVEITYGCDLNCIMCYNPTRVSATPREKATIWDILRSLAQSCVPHVYLIGGEPTFGYTARELREFVDFMFACGTSTTIVTNGQNRLEETSPHLACFGIPLHGADADTHDSITGKAGSWARAMANASAYIADGHDVRIIPVVMGRNHNQMFRIAEIAWRLGAESVYFDVFEPGGIGEINARHRAERIEPNIDELRASINQIIAAHDAFRFPGGIGFGTALPFCIDSRLIERGLLASCGAGVDFAAVTNNGDLRLCNQSSMVFGNVLARSIEDIWSDPAVESCFRRLLWVEEPCSSCPVLEECGAGCKVDSGCKTGEFVIDRHVRQLATCMDPTPVWQPRPATSNQPQMPGWRLLRVSPFFKMVGRYAEDGALFFKTRYQTVSIATTEKTLLDSICETSQPFAEESFVTAYSDDFDAMDLRQFVSTLVQAGALDVLEEQ